MSPNFKSFFEQMQTALVQNPQARQVRFSVNSRQIEGFRSEVRVRNFAVTVDEPPALSGTDQGPSPVELILAALATCQEVTYRLYASKMDIPLNGVSVSVSGNLDLRGFFAVDDRVRPGYQSVKSSVTLDSPAAPEELARLAEVVEQHCPVFDIVANQTPVETTVERVDTSLVETQSAVA